MQLEISLKLKSNWQPVWQKKIGEETCCGFSGEVLGRWNANRGKLFREDVLVCTKLKLDIFTTFYGEIKDSYFLHLI